MSKKKEAGFEESLQRLQDISDTLEKGEIGLEDSIKLYEEGIKLAKNCFSTLKNAELKVTELKKQLENGIVE
jgi:exodeoxyribonuclease VII small subunit